MSHIFHRSLFPEPILAVKGEGIRIFDDKGRQFLDACAGAGVSCLGHGDQGVVRAMAHQAERLEFAHTSFFTTTIAEELADKLIENAPQGIAKVYFVCDGSEAIEAGLKMAHQYHRERQQPKRTRIISRWESYHGATLGALAVGGNRVRRANFEGLLVDVAHIDPCYPYRFKLPEESIEEYGRRAADQLEQKILELGPETVSCFVAETVAGATLGAVPPAPGYFERIREICDRYGVLLILDEVMCGLGRCGTMHACEAERIVPDLLIVAKGLGAGYMPLGAVMVSEKVFAPFEKNGRNFIHGHSLLAHPVACAAALHVQHEIADRKLLANVRERSAQLTKRLREQFEQHPHVGEIRGRGLLQALEFVADRETREAFDPAVRLQTRIKAHAMAHGLLVYPISGFIDGVRGDHILLAPPFTVTEEEIDLIVDRLAYAIKDCFAELN